MQVLQGDTVGLLGTGSQGLQGLKWAEGTEGQQQQCLQRGSAHMSHTYAPRKAALHGISPPRCVVGPNRPSTPHSQFLSTHLRLLEIQNILVAVGAQRLLFVLPMF